MWVFTFYTCLCLLSMFYVCINFYPYIFIYLFPRINILIHISMFICSYAQVLIKKNLVLKYHSIIIPRNEISKF